MTLPDHLKPIKSPVPTFETQVISRLAALEEHIINLIYPIQQSAKILASPDLQGVVRDLNRAISAFTSICDGMVNKTRHHTEQMQKSFEAIDIGQAFSEIKYIGNRLKQIEELLKEINEDGIKRQIMCKIEVEGFNHDVDIKKEKMSIKIENCDLSIRSQNICRMADIITLKDLASYKRHELTGFRNIGRKTIQELEELLGKYGLSFRI